MCRYCYGDLFASSSDLTHIQTNVLITAAQCAEMPGKETVNCGGEKKSAAATLHKNETEVKALLNYWVECVEMREE